jgi:hypothetical protein
MLSYNGEERRPSCPMGQRNRIVPRLAKPVGSVLSLKEEDPYQGLFQKLQYKVVKDGSLFASSALPETSSTQLTSKVSPALRICGIHIHDCYT